MNEQMTDRQLSRWKRLAERATEGPWTVSRRAHAVKNATGEYIADYTTLPHTAETRADLAFIAMARAAVPALIAEVERLRKANRA